MYYFRVCAKVIQRVKTKSSSNYEVCGRGGDVCVNRLKVKDAITQGGAAGCGVEVDVNSSLGPALIRSTTKLPAQLNQQTLCCCCTQEPRKPGGKHTPGLSRGAGKHTHLLHFRVKVTTESAPP